MHVEGVRVKGVQNVRTTVFDYFSNHFKPLGVSWPSVEGLNFCKLSFADAGNLTKPFSQEEVKQAMWDCDSYKSPGPDDINFGFIKEFWDVLKIDFMRFVSEFHRSGRLTKGLNSTFIALISKVTALSPWWAACIRFSQRFLLTGCEMS